MEKKKDHDGEKTIQPNSNISQFVFFFVFLYANVFEKMFLKIGTIPKDIKHAPNFRRKCSSFSLEHDQLYKRNKNLKLLVVQKFELPQIYNELHTNFHFGRDKMCQIFRERYYFVGYYKWIAKISKECVHCSQKRFWLAKKTIAPLQPIPVEASNFARVHLDMTAGVRDVTNFFSESFFPHATAKYIITSRKTFNIYLRK